MSGQRSISGGWRDPAVKLRVQRDGQRKRFRTAHPEYMREYCREWRERKKKQAAAIERWADQVERFTYAMRCQEISREAREMRQ